MGSQGRNTIRSEALVDWFRVFGRDLPWRRSRDPWLVLVSELMLQQTQVKRVEERLPEFLKKFGTPRELAEAGPAEVITEWSGLGYNRRALNLHRAAVQIVDGHGGSVPTDLDELLALPGVGPYTARAVRVFAFERPDGVVDTNIGRVLARWEGRSLKPREAQLLADQLVPPDHAWVWNQAIMELGALTCKRDPECHRCPVSSHCEWFASQCSGPDPSHGSASVSKPQGRFDGSDRQGRAGMVRALTTGPVSPDDLASVMGWPNDQSRAERVLESLLQDGLVVVGPDGRYRLPD
ncbi:MAG: A/G-specific adenine glycosylase [Acidimicrobiales bacterium]